MFPAERVHKDERSGEPPGLDQESGAINLPWTGPSAHALFTLDEDFATDPAVLPSRLADCGVMRNLMVAPSAVNSKTLVQLKKICRGSTRRAADRGGA
jgi:hypothetical protein